MTATEETATETTNGVNLTDGAASKVKSLLEQEGRTDLALRIAVQPGGCSGLRYQLFFDERSLDGDQIFQYNDVSVVVDRMSLPYLDGATIDFVDTIEKQGFTIDNPVATGSCAWRDPFHPSRNYTHPPDRWSSSGIPCHPFCFPCTLRSQDR